MSIEHPLPPYDHTPATAIVGRHGILRVGTSLIDDARTLRDLECDGFVTRTVFPTKPPSVEYRLTDIGTSVLVPLPALVDWAERHQSAMKGARASFNASTNEPRA